jgi:hypothetical protein
LEVKIGIQMAPRELAVDTASSVDEVMDALNEALAHGSVFRLDDRKGDVVLVPAAKIAYVEIDIVAPRRVGFASS